MNLRMLRLAIIIVPALAAAPVLGVDQDQPSRTGLTSCTMRVNLRGWSFFYKTAKGWGTVQCDNGQAAQVGIKTEGGGLTFGKWDILDGTANFSRVQDIMEVFGSYAEIEAQAGAVKSAGAAALSNGEVSLVLAGTGRGFVLGLGIGKFTITRR